MKAIVLAAGKGKRISEDIMNIHKATLKINQEPIIRRSVKMLLELQCSVVVCTGYQYQQIHEALEGLDVTYYHNPFYEISNNIVSLWLTKDEFDHQDIIILNADIVVEKSLIKLLCSSKGDLVMATDSGRVLDGDYFFHLSDKGELLEYGPELPLEKRSCEYIGISKVNALCNEAFKKCIDTLINSGQLQIYYEYVFFSFMGSKDIQLSTIDFKGFMWREIDYLKDYKKALVQFGNSPKDKEEKNETDY